MSLKLDHYILGKTIGVGAFGKVKCQSIFQSSLHYCIVATHDISKLNVAIKIINRKQVKDFKMQAKIKREIRVLRFLKHPNIIKMYEVLDTPSHIFVIMEYVSGGELFDLISTEGQQPEARCRHYFRQIVEGVDYCHNHLIAHRDLKPENIFIDAEADIIKIGDFGLANLMRDGKCLQTSCGSPNYAAPEVISNRSYCGTEVDAWSVGVILFAMLAGYLPFDEDDMMKLFKKIKEGQYEIPHFFSPYAKDLIQRLLQTNPLNRLKFHQIKMHPWLNEDRPLMIDVLGFQKIDGKLKIKQQLFNQLLKQKFNFHDLAIDEIKKAIKLRKDYSFVVSYEMMYDQYIRQKAINKEVNEDDTQNLMFQNAFTVLNQTVNAKSNVLYSPKGLQSSDNNWVFGFQYSYPARTLMKYIYECLGKLDTSIQLKNSSYQIKCFHKIVRKISTFAMQFAMDTRMDDSYLNEKKLDEFKETKLQTSKAQKTSKDALNEIIFFIQIYEMPNEIDQLLDIQLNKGHPIIFLEFVNKFVSLLNESLPIK